MLKKKLKLILFLIVTLQFTLLQNVFAYLDPGTGSFIYQVLVATVICGFFSVKMYWQKIKNFFSRHFFRKEGK